MLQDRKLQSIQYVCLRLGIFISNITLVICPSPCSRIEYSQIRRSLSAYSRAFILGSYSSAKTGELLAYIHCPVAYVFIYLIASPDHSARPIIRDLISHLQAHAHYPSVFETYYLQVTSEFYAAESTQKAESVGAHEFLRHCVLRRSEEEARSKKVLPEGSWGPVNKMTEKGLLEDRLSWLAQEGECIHNPS